MWGLRLEQEQGFEVLARAKVRVGEVVVKGIG